MSDSLSLSEKRQLVRLARAALEAAVRGESPPSVNAAELPPALTQSGASFVTLMNGGELRGCIGGLHAHQPLYEDVRDHTAQSALRDYRFPAVTAAEAPHIEIEISILTEPQPLPYDSPDHLLRLLRPNVDGVILQQGYRRATFLPQVWERVPDPATFLAMLCEKMGAAPNLWRHAKLEVQTYQVEKFTESEVGD
jgi:hypothetical protein